MEKKQEHQHIHLIGIGGSGLSAIARILVQSGYEVSGSDRQSSQITRKLQAEGITVYEGHQVQHIQGADLVVRSSAIKEDNPEVQEALQMGVPVLKRADFLEGLLQDKVVLAVAGTHGKTTTTSMLAWLLTVLGKDPSYIIGGLSQNLASNAHAGKGEYFVIEADEYDGMFLGLHPHLAVITNIEHDHPDCYPTAEVYYQAFMTFTKGINPQGTLILCAEDKEVLRLYTELINTPLALWLYGAVAKQKQGEQKKERDERDQDIENGYWSQVDDVTSRGSNFEVWHQGNEIASIQLQIPGEHNLLNATAVLAAAHNLGLPLAEAAQALNEFQGSGRRFEIRGVYQGVPFIDDYAHHPTEVKAAIRAAQSRFPQRSLWVVWQPHTFSRIEALYNNFVSAFDEAQNILVMDVYAARETCPDSFYITNLIKDIQQHTMGQVLYTPTRVKVITTLKEQLRSDDVVLVLSAGDANELMLELLSNRVLQRKTLSSFENELKSLFGEKVHFNIPLMRYTTVQVGGKADILIEANTRLSLIKGVVFAWQHQIPLTLLGSGSNVLISDKGIRGIVIINQTQETNFFHEAVAKQKQFSDSEGESAWVWAESGTNLSMLAHKAAAKSLAGLEWAVGIPGSVGGAIVGNAGAHGGMMAANMIVAEILQQEKVKGLFYSLSLEDEDILRSLSEFWHVGRLAYEYRSSILKRDAAMGIVLSTRLRLTPKPQESIQQKMEDVLTQRRMVQPTGASMGSIFNNPPNHHAGRLIDSCALKGKQIGKAQISNQHANFFINIGGASAEDFWDLICLAKETVKEKTGVSLTLEIERLGEW